MYTKEFIEKVSKAKEIQKLCKYELGDWFYTANLKRQFILDTITVEHNREMIGELVEDNDYYWLPTLKQLWDILHQHYQECGDNPVRWGQSINKFILKSLYEEAISIENEYLADMQDFLLYFVMRNVYKKSWNSDKNIWEANNGS
jgi:hypothetical protein